MEERLEMQGPGEPHKEVDLGFISDLPGKETENYYEKVTLEEAEAFILADMKSAVRSVIAIGYYLKNIRDRELFLEAGYHNIWDYARERYGFSKSTASRYMARNDRFSVGGNSPILAEEYREYSKAQLQEMLSLDGEALDQVTPEMTVRQIRDLKQLPSKEIPYYEIPGQITLSDFPDLGMQENADPEPVFKGRRWEVSSAELLGGEQGNHEVATSQQDGAKHLPQEPKTEGVLQEMPISETEGVIDGGFVEAEASGTDFRQEDILTDLQIARQELEKEQKLLSQGLQLISDEKDIYIRMMKIRVAALASCVCDLEEIENPAPLPEPIEQPEPPVWKNNEQRKEWLRNYRDWGLWYRDERLGIEYYKYDFENGARLIAEVYPEDRHGRWFSSSYLHLVGGPEPPKHPQYGFGKWGRHECYTKHPDSETELVEFLKFVQKE